METIIKTTERPENPSAIWELFPQATILVEVNAKLRNHIRIDDKGHRLFVTKDNEFIVDGKCIYEGEYTDFKWKNATIPIAIKNEKGYSILIEGKVVFNTSECDWTLIKGKVVASCNQGLFYNGTKILEKKDYDRWGIFDDQLVIENALGCHQVLLPEQL